MYNSVFSQFPIYEHFVYKVFCDCKLCCNKYSIYMSLNISALYSRTGITESKDSVYFSICFKIAFHK